MSGKRIRYEQVYDNEWIAPVMKGWRCKCCNCGLVHVFDFRIAGKGRWQHVQFKAKAVRKRSRKNKLGTDAHTH